MVRVGIIGMGYMGCTHLAAYLRTPGVEVVGFSARDARRLAGDFSGVWGNLGNELPSRLSMRRLRATDDPLALIRANDIDAVSICTPTPTHAGLLLAAIEAGKHVLCEKPLCRYSEEAVGVCAAAAGTNLVLMPGMVVRFSAAYELLCEAVRSGRWGALRALHFVRSSSPPPGWFQDAAQSGGALLDLHLHDTDAICGLLGLPFAVSSRGVRGPSGAIDHVHARYEYADTDAVVTAEASWLAPDGFPFRARLTATFADATADFELGRSPELLVYRSGEARAVNAGSESDHEREIGHFIRCVRDGMAPQVGVRDALASLRVVEAERRSVEIALPVQIADASWRASGATA